ncbi:MAG: HNH endonuclease, partial [Pseudomonadota bacterium]
TAKILKLDITGAPIRWISQEDGALLYCRDQVAWEAGTQVLRLRGGVNRGSGRRSVLEVNSIVAVAGRDPQGADRPQVPALTNLRLFRRDDCLCMYCGVELAPRQLTRDHVVPLSRGGTDTWENSVTACRPCNHRKADRLLEELGLSLLAVPYVPNLAEAMILVNRTILADQMAFLQERVGRRSRWQRGAQVR